VSGVAAEPLPDALRRLEGADAGLLALGIPRCPACAPLPATLAALAAARPGLPVAYAVLERPEDWALREPLLWPRGIRVGRASVPALALLRRGRAVAARHGGGPAAELDRWLAAHLGAAASPLPAGPTAAERAALEDGAARRSQRLMAGAMR
jgi:hypothetical protein